MSQDIVTIRRQLKQAPSTLRQGKTMSAVQAVVAALRLVLTTPLMKSEKDEFSGLVKDAVDYLNNDAALRKIYPLELEYRHGGEKQLFDDMTELLEVLKDESTAEATEVAKAMEAKKTAALTAGQEHLDAKEFDKARTVFSDISGEYPTDSQLKGAIGEKALNAGLYEDAAEYLGAAVDLDPNALPLYNRLAIALRKLGRFDVAEGYYQKALPLAPEDPYLLFNVGRLYAEWGKWDKALEFGEKAYTVEPSFEEAKKLAAFARRKLES